MIECSKEDLCEYCESDLVVRHGLIENAKEMKRNDKKIQKTLDRWVVKKRSTVKRSVVSKHKLGRRAYMRKHGFIRKKEGDDIRQYLRLMN